MYACACAYVLYLILTGMMAKYQRQASTKGSASTPAASKSFAGQSSQQHSTQPKENEEVCSVGLEILFKYLASFCSLSYCPPVTI